MGFILEEVYRVDRFCKFECENLLILLIENKLVKFDCFMMLMDVGILLFNIY